MRFLMKLGLLVVIALVAQMTTDVIRIAWSYPTNYAYSTQFDTDPASAIYEVERDYSQRCSATKWIVTKVIELPLDEAQTQPAVMPIASPEE